MKRLLSLEDAINEAKKHNGKCLSTEYRNVRTKMKWQCALNHTWETSYNNIRSGCWCPICRNKKKHL